MTLADVFMWTVTVCASVLTAGATIGILAYGWHALEREFLK